MPTSAPTPKTFGKTTRPTSPAHMQTTRDISSLSLSLSLDHILLYSLSTRRNLGDTRGAARIVQLKICHVGRPFARLAGGPSKGVGTAAGAASCYIYLPGASIIVSLCVREKFHGVRAYMYTCVIRV